MISKEKTVVLQQNPPSATNSSYSPNLLTVCAGMSLILVLMVLKYPTPLYGTFKR
jgi:hypothetical protein